MEYKSPDFAASAADPIASAIARDGFAGPFPLLTSGMCDDLFEHLIRRTAPAPMDWPKGRTATDRIVYELGATPALVARLQPMLGEDIVLFAAYAIQREPGGIHAWHSDVESYGAGGSVLSAWIGVRNAGSQSGLRFIPGSHRYARSVQEATAALGETRATMTDERVLEAARNHDPAAEFVQPMVSDGEFILFDSRIWHAGFSDHATQTRFSFLLQYTAAATQLAIPLGGDTWPFRFLASPPVPVVLVSGSGRAARNRVVPPPPPLATRSPMLTTLAHTVALPLAEDPEGRSAPLSPIQGTDAHAGGHRMPHFGAEPGHSPHLPHTHREEELLIVLDGTVTVELADEPHGTLTRQEPLQPGMLSYYPATQHHTLRNIGTGPATYLMYKWHAGAANIANPLGTSFFRYDATPHRHDRGMVQAVLFEGPTECLGKLHAHLTVLQPGAGYDAHADGYDVAILLLKGEIETVGTKVKPLGLVFYSAGELHGMQNVGSEPAVYLVFEFHSPGYVTQVRTGAPGGTAAPSPQEAQARAAPRPARLGAQNPQGLCQNVPLKQERPGLASRPCRSIGRSDRLALRELEAAAGLRAAVLLTLDRAAVAGEEAALLQRAAQVRLVIGQRAWRCRDAPRRPGPRGRRRRRCRSRRTGRRGSTMPNGWLIIMRSTGRAK